MLYSELLEMARIELNVSKARFAEIIGVSLTTLYRYLDNPASLPSNEILTKLETLGIDISDLDLNDIYYEFVLEKLPDFSWCDDISGNRIGLIHKKCGKASTFTLSEIRDYKHVNCPFCLDAKKQLETQNSVKKKEDKTPKILYDNKGNQLFKLSGSRLTQFFKKTKYNIIYIPEGITEIGRKAFYFYLDLRKIFFPCSIEIICEEAFFGCWLLEDIILPEGTKEIRELAFGCCDNLKRLYIPSTLEVIHDKAFGWNNDGLKKVSVEISPDNKKYRIENNAIIDLETKKYIAQFE